MTARRATAVAPAPVASVLALERRGRYLRGLRLVDSLLADGRAGDLLAAKARLLAARGRYVDALEVADLAVDLWPRSPVAHASRADVLADRDRYHEAVEAADQALALDHSHAMALRVEALALSELGQVSEGRQLASRAIAADPDDLDSHLVLAQVLTKVSASEARRYADKLVRESRDATSLAGRALILLLVDDLDGAATTAEEAVALDPENEAAGLAAMVIDLTAGRWDETIVRAETHRCVAACTPPSHPQSPIGRSAARTRPGAQCWSWSSSNPNNPRRCDCCATCSSTAASGPRSR